MAKLLVEPGAKDIAIGTPLLVLAEDEADVGKFADFSATPGGGADGGGEAKKDAPKPAAEDASSGDGAGVRCCWQSARHPKHCSSCHHICARFVISNVALVCQCPSTRQSG